LRYSESSLSFASANRDERHYPGADTFDVARGSADHLSFGHGAHLCAGVHLARLEMRLLLEAMTRHVGTITVRSRRLNENNILRGWATLETEFTAR
ncbi:MAG: cytochrome P450, partial [Acidimicrobiales bacterium]